MGKLTQAAKDKISRKAKLRWKNPEYRKEVSERTKRQWRDRTIRKQMCLGIKKSCVGRNTPEFRAKVSKQRYGKTMAEIHGPRKARSIYFKRYGFYPENCPDPSLVYRHRRGWRAKLFSRRVFERDKFKCQDCDKTKVRIHAHHIKSWIDYPKLRFAVSNGVTLCHDCHWDRHRKQGLWSTRPSYNIVRVRRRRMKLRVRLCADLLDSRSAPVVPLGGKKL